MQSANNSTPRPDILQLLGYAELENRVPDLERERDGYRDQLVALLDVAHKLIVERDRLREQSREQARTIRELRALLAAGSPRDRRAA